MLKATLANVVSHKGAGFSAPENTVIAFKKAAEMGFLYTEFDVRLAQSGHLVVSNRDNLKYVSGHDVSISQSAYTDLKTYNIAQYHDATGEKCTLPLLSDIIPLNNALGLKQQIELKVHNNAQELAEASAIEIDSYFINKSVEDLPLITSFSAECLRAFQHAATIDYPTGLLIHSEATEDWQQEANKGFFDFIHIFSKHVLEKPIVVDDIKNAGYHLNAYKVRSKEDGNALVNKGVQRFTTDSPEIFI